MRKQAFAIAAAIAVLPLALGAGSASAQTAPAVTFAAVDGIRYDAGFSGTFHVKGIVQGEAAAREVLFHWSSSAPDEQRSCERFVLLAMERPGRYLLRLQHDPWRFVTLCSLSRATP